MHYFIVDLTPTNPWTHLLCNSEFDRQINFEINNWTWFKIHTSFIGHCLIGMFELRAILENSSLDQIRREHVSANQQKSKLLLRSRLIDFHWIQSDTWPPPQSMTRVNEVVEPLIIWIYRSYTFRFMVRAAMNNSGYSIWQWTNGVSLNKARNVFSNMPCVKIVCRNAILWRIRAKKIYVRCISNKKNRTFNKNRMCGGKSASSLVSCQGEKCWNVLKRLCINRIFKKMKWQIVMVL